MDVDVVSLINDEIELLIFFKEKKMKENLSLCLYRVISESRAADTHSHLSVFAFQ